MTTYLLDSPIIISVLAGSRKRLGQLSNLLAEEHLLALSPIVAAEVYAAYRQGSRTKAQALLKSFEMLSCGLSVARLAGELIQEAAKAKRRLTEPNALIAATAIIHGCRLLTDRPRQFPVPKLKLSTGDEQR